MTKPYNFEIKEKNGESQDKIIKRFLKKTSKSKIVQECVDRMYFKSNSEKNRNKRSRKTFIKRKIQEAHEADLVKENLNV
jgi:ribosomal protein S21